MSARACRLACLLVGLGGAALLGGCATPPRFRDQPPAWRVEDARDIPEPAPRPFLRATYFTHVLVMRPLTRALELRGGRPAANTNALDDVPDSTWFTQRIGRHPLEPGQVARGPDVNGPPRLPITVVRGKSGGKAPGFLVRDARGIRFIVKFDTLRYPELQTATGVIVNRALWAAGYQVPADHVFTFAPDELLLSDEATYEDALGRKQRLCWAHVQQQMANAPRLPGGHVRALASEFLAGKPKGGFDAEGTRPDDPNDRIPHEDRRELRGLRVLAAWLNHTDLKEDNTLDMYVTEGGRRFLRHYLVDLGQALGVHRTEQQRPEDGWEYAWDWERNGLALLALGLWKRPWEDPPRTPWPAVGHFGAEPFEPALWRPDYPFPPFSEAQPEDLFWGARLVLRFERPHLEALVAAGRLSSPDAAAYLVEALWQRRLKIGRTWLEALSALDDFTLRDGRLCATDLGVRHGLATGAVLERLPGPGAPPHALESFPVQDDGTVCLPARGGGAYTVDRLRLRRGTALRPVMQVHYVADDAPRVLGLIRSER